MDTKKRWMGTLPTACDVCGRALRLYFVDGKTTMGPWGVLCLGCHSEVGVGLGLGKGQKYEFQDGAWVKVEG